MPKYTITNKGNVIQCKWGCTVKHEHYVGSYENALKYFGVDQKDVKPYGHLINIVIYYQTSDKIQIRRLSNELFDILVYKQSQRRFFQPVELREQNAIDVLNQAYDMNIIYDERLLKYIRNNEKYKIRYRGILYDEWRKEMYRKGLVLNY